jgi:hypothetical protein
MKIIIQKFLFIQKHLNFEKGWKHSHGPKYSTLVTYGYAGPFKTEQECRSVNSKLNKQKKQNERS